MTLINIVPVLWFLPSTILTSHDMQLETIGADVDDARVCGGTHWRYDQDAGNVLGPGRD